MLFCGLDLFAPMPDETTRCRFRSVLVKSGVHDDLLVGVCRALQDRAEEEAPTIRKCISVLTRKRGGSGTAGSVRRATK